MWRRVVRWKVTDVSEDYTTSIFKVQEWAEQASSKKQVHMENFNWI